MVEELRYALSVASKRVAEEFTVDLQDRAVENGWPRAVAEQIFVDFDLDASMFFVSYNQDYEGLIFDLEYGDGDNPAVPVMRVYENDINRLASPRLDLLLQEELLRTGVL